MKTNNIMQIFRFISYIQKKYIDFIKKIKNDKYNYSSASIISPYTISISQPLGPQQKCCKSNFASIFSPLNFLFNF